MKKYILFLLSFMLMNGVGAMDPAVTYKVVAQFTNKTEKPKYTVNITDESKQSIQIEAGTSSEKIELSGSEYGLFITYMIIYDSAGEKLIFDSNNIVIKQMNHAILENINCGKKDTFYFTFDDYIIKALKEAEDVAKEGSLSKAKSKKLVEQTAEGKYKLKKTGYPFFDYDYKNTNKIAAIKNDASQAVTVVFNGDKKLIIAQGEQGAISVAYNFVLSSVRINDHPLTTATVAEVQTKIEETMPRHMCGALAIDDDLLDQIGVSAIGTYVTFRNTSSTPLTMVIDDTKVMYLDVPAMKRQGTRKNLEEIKQLYKKGPDGKQEPIASSSNAAPVSPRGERTLSPRRDRTRERRGSNELFEIRDRPVRTIDLTLYNNRYIQSFVINGQRFERNSPLVVELNARIKKGIHEIIIDDSFLEEYGVKKTQS